MSNNNEKLFKDKWFDLRWFRSNSEIAKRFLTFGSTVFQFLDNDQCRMKVTDSEIEVYLKDKRNKFFRIKVFQRDGDSINTDPKIAVYNELVYAIAIKLEYLKFPKTDSLSKWCKVMGYEYQIKQKDVSSPLLVKVRDKYKNTVNIPKEIVWKIAYFVSRPRLWRFYKKAGRMPNPNSHHKKYSGKWIKRTYT